MISNGYFKLRRSQLSEADPGSSQCSEDEAGSGVYIVQKKRKRCSQTYLFIAFMLLSVAIALMGYMAGRRHSTLVSPITRPAEASFKHIIQEHPHTGKGHPVLIQTIPPPTPRVRTSASLVLEKGGSTQSTTGILSSLLSLNRHGQTQNMSSQQEEKSEADPSKNPLKIGKADGDSLLERLLKLLSNRGVVAPSDRVVSAAADSLNTNAYAPSGLNITSVERTLQVEEYLSSATDSLNTNANVPLVLNITDMEKTPQVDEYLSSATDSLNTSANVPLVLNITDMEKTPQVDEYLQIDNTLTQRPTPATVNPESDVLEDEENSEYTFKPKDLDLPANPELKTVTQSTEVETPPPFGTTPPPCDEYPSSYIKDFVSHKLHSLGPQGQQLLGDFKRALKTNSAAGVIDIGAELALYGLVAASMRRPVLVLEPNHACVENVEKMLELNKLSSLVTVKEFAVSDKKGYGRFLPGPQNNTYIAPVELNNVNVERLDNHVVVNIITLDDVARYVTFDKAILKINLGEGPLQAVFNSAEQLFNKVTIQYIFMNWIYDKSIDKAAERTVSFLRKRQFEPRSRLQNGFSLIPAFYRYWPKNVIWVNSVPW